MKQLIYNSSFFAILFIALAAITFTVCDWAKKSANGQTFIKIDGDGRDYYSYLPSAFITQDLRNLSVNDPFTVETPTGNIKLHPVGIAVLELPFFGLGYLAAMLSAQPLDGYSMPFQLSICLAALCYLILGLLFSYKTLMALGFKKETAAWSLLLLFFGTTLLSFVVTEPSMSHIYSFALIAGFAYYTQKLSTQFSPRSVFRLAVLLGLIILVRPVNVIVLLAMPFFFQSFRAYADFLRKFFSNKKLALLSTLTVVGLYSIQLFVWFYQTGQFFQQSYSGQGFYFSDPKFFPMLFSFQSGIFVYTPLLLITIPALWFIYKENAYKAWSLLLFLVLMIYVFSSWWCWTYFDGIGTRPVVDFYILAAIGLAYLLKALSSLAKKWTAGLALGLCVAFNLVVCYQYKEGIIQGSGMNFDKFSYVFLETSPAYQQVLGGCYDLQPFSKEKKTPIKTYGNSYDEQKTGFFNYAQKEWGVEYKSGALGVDSRKLHVKISFDRLHIRPDATKDAIIALSLNDDKNTCKFWQSFKLDDVPADKPYSNWKHYDYGVSIGSTIKETDELSVFVWNTKQQAFGIDNFKIELYDYGHIN